MATFYVQFGEDEMSDEIEFGSEAYQELVDAGTLTDESSASPASAVLRELREGRRIPAC